MGKIDASAFQQSKNNNDSETESIQKQGIKVGKLNTSKLFVKENEEQEDIPSRPVSVGKLNVGTFYQVNEMENQITFQNPLNFSKTMMLKRRRRERPLELANLKKMCGNQRLSRRNLRLNLLQKM